MNRLAFNWVNWSSFNLSYNAIIDSPADGFFYRTNALILLQFCEQLQHVYCAASHILSAFWGDKSYLIDNYRLWLYLPQQQFKKTLEHLYSFRIRFAQFHKCQRNATHLSQKIRTPFVINFLNLQQSVGGEQTKQNASSWNCSILLNK